MVGAGVVGARVVGLPVGEVVGASVGEVVGELVGTVVGALVITSDGCNEGASARNGLGTEVSRAVGPNVAGRLSMGTPVVAREG